MKDYKNKIKSQQEISELIDKFKQENKDNQCIIKSSRFCSIKLFGYINTYGI